MHGSGEQPRPCLGDPRREALSPFREAPTFSLLKTERPCFPGAQGAGDMNGKNQGKL